MPEEDLSSVQKRIDQARALHARAQVENDNALANLQRTKKALQEEFGISTGEQIKAAIAELEESYEALLNEAEKQLAEAEGD